MDSAFELLLTTRLLKKHNKNEKLKLIYNKIKIYRMVQEIIKKQLSHLRHHVIEQVAPFQVLQHQVDFVRLLVDCFQGNNTRVLAIP